MSQRSSRKALAAFVATMIVASGYADTTVGCSGQPGDYEMCVGDPCYQRLATRTPFYRFFTSECDDADSYTCVVGDQRADGTYDMWPAAWDPDSSSYVSCDSRGPTVEVPPEPPTPVPAEDASVPVVDTDASTDDSWWDTEEPEPLPPRHCARTEGLEFVAYHTLEGEGALCVPIVLPVGDTETEGDDREEAVVVVALEPAYDDHDLCVWESGEEWESHELYAQCHEWRHSRLPGLHCRSSLGGTDSEQVRVDSNAGGLMACVVPWQGGTGGYTLSFGAAETQPETN